MDDSKWAKYAALGGPAFVVLVWVGGFLPGAPPAMDASTEKTAEFYADNADAIKVGTFLSGLAAVGLLWWFGSLWRRMVAAENGKARMSIVALGGLLLGGAMSLGSSVIGGTLALRYDEAGQQVRFFSTMVYVLIAMSGFGMLVFLAAVTSLSHRTRLFPAWTNYVGWLAALGMLLGSMNVATDSTAFVACGTVGFILASIWILALSWDLWKRPAT